MTTTTLTSPEFFSATKQNIQRSFDANETYRLLRSNIQIYWSWGCDHVECIVKDGQPVGILLRVNGNHHKGLVLITLAWNDTYIVTIVSNDNEVLDTFTDVYFDVLVETIDNRIEKIDDYNF